MVLLLLYW